MAGPRLEPRDLLVAPFHHGDSWGALDLTLDPPAGTAESGVDADFNVAPGREALAQALLLRLLTPLGGLAALGHVDYGSRLHELIGELHTTTGRQLARSYTLRALTSDRRVEEVTALHVLEQTPSEPDTIRIEAAVKARHFDDPFELAIEVAL